MSVADLGVVSRATQRTILVGTLLAFASAALYGGNVPAARIASQSGMPGADLIAWRALILMPLLLLAAPIAKARILPRAGEWASIIRLAVAASFTATFYLSSVDHLPVPMAVTLFYTFPLIVMLLSIAIERRRPQPAEIAVFAVAFLGLLLAVGPSFAGLKPIGIVYALLGAVACAFMFIFAGRVGNAPIRNTFWTQVAMGPIALGFALGHGGPASITVFAIAPYAISIAMAAYAAGYLMQMMASARLAPARMSLIFLFEPVAAIMVAWFVLGETLGPLQVAGVGLILAALAAEVLLGMRKVSA